MKKTPLLDSSYKFSLQIFNLCRSIASKHNEFVITKQLLRSGTSIGANIQEATEAQSRKDFISKLSIALKEAKESIYWLRLLKDADLGQQEVMENQIQQCNELKYMLIASIKTSKDKIK